MDTIHFPLLAALLSILAFSASFTSAGDPDMLQDVCVADLNSGDPDFYFNIRIHMLFLKKKNL